MKPIIAGVLSPIFYIIYTANIPTSSITLLATFADDTAILASDKDPTAAVNALQPHLDKINS